MVDFLYILKMLDPNIISHINLMHWLFQSIAMGITAFLLPGLRITGLLGGFLAVAAIAFINAHLWDAALFFQVPHSLTSQAVIVLLTNGIIFWIVVKILPSIEIDGFLPAIAAPIIFTVISVLLDKYLPLIDWESLWQILQDNFLKIKNLVSNEQTLTP